MNRASPRAGRLLSDGWHRLRLERLIGNCGRCARGVAAGLVLLGVSAWADGVGASFYRLDAAIDFNVLDSVRIEPATGTLTLQGHRNARYGNGRIPYLDHLATLLAQPEPQFSLIWTPESEERVEALFRRLDSPAEVRALGARWGEWIDAYDQVTPMGRFFMPLFGVRVPTNNRYDIAAAIVRGGGNERGAYIIETAGFAFQALGTPQEQNGTANLMRAIGAHSVMNQLKGQVERGEISDAEGQFRFGLAIAERLEAAFDLAWRPVSAAYERSMRSTGDLGTALTEAMREFDRQLRPILEQAMNRVWERTEQIIVPPEVLHETLGAAVEVVPEYYGLDPSTQLARVMFEADYLGKQLPNRADLEGRIPGYQTDFSFERSRPGAKFQSTARQHMWVSIDQANFEESADRLSLKTREIKMRFNIREIVGGRSVPAPPGEYEQMLTSLYDEFAAEFSVLHELREAAKLALVAKWVRARLPEFALPREGRLPASPPSRAPGLLYLAWSPRPGAISASLMAMGGMDFVVAPGSLPFDLNFPPFSRATAVDVAESDEPDAVVAKALARAGDRPWLRPVAAVSSEVTADGVVTTVRLSPPAVATADAPTRVVERPATAAVALWDEQALRADLAREQAAMQAARSPRERALHQLRAAQALHELGENEAALAAFREAQSAAPDLPIIRLMLARAQFEEGDTAAASLTLQEYLELEPGNAAAAQLLAELQAKHQAGAPASGNLFNGTSAFASGPRVAFGPAIQGLATGSLFEGSTDRPASTIDSGLAAAGPVPAVGAMREAPADRAATIAQLTQRKTELMAAQKKLESELADVRARRSAGQDTIENQMVEKRLTNQVAKAKQEVAEAEERLVSFTVQFPPEEDEAAKPGAAAPSPKAETPARKP